MSPRSGDTPRGKKHPTWGDNVVVADFGARRRRELAAGQTTPQVPRQETETWAAATLMEALAQQADSGRLARGREYYRAGKILGVELQTNVISGLVAGSQLEPFDVSIRLRSMGKRRLAFVEQELLMDASHVRSLVKGSAPGVDVEEFSIGRWAFQAVEAEINSRAEAQSFVESVQEMANKRNLVVKYALKGTVDLHTAAWLDQQLEESALGFARLYPRERLMDLHVVPDLDELAEANFGEGFIDSAAKELMESAQEDNRAASDALRLLYRLSAATRKDAV